MAEEVLELSKFKQSEMAKTIMHIVGHNEKNWEILVDEKERDYETLKTK
jgi:hypothetical protein